MLNLNLLPPQEKQNLAHTLRVRAVIALGGGFILVMVIFLAFLLPVFFRLKIERDDILNELNLAQRSRLEEGLVKEAGEVKSINRLAAAASREAAPRLYPLIEALIRDVPPQIRLDALRFRADAGEAVLDGTSPTRADLLALLRRLEENPSAASVSYPPSALIRETNIRFSVTVKLK